MVSTTEFLPYLIEQLKVIHTNERIGGAPYWTHPVHCLERLLECWGNVSPEAQIAILFHDTIEDSQEGEKAILKALAELPKTALAINENKVLSLVRDLTNPEEKSSEDVVHAIMTRFLSGQVLAESYLLKSIDILDNTTDLLSCHASTPDAPDIRKALSRQRWVKYSGYVRSIESGWAVYHARDAKLHNSAGIAEALSKTIKTIDRNLIRLASIIGIE